MKETGRRAFLSIYFPHRDAAGLRKTRNVCVAFSLPGESVLLGAARRRTTTELKRVLAIYSYDQLVKSAEKEERAVGAFIKRRLEEGLLKGTGRAARRRLVTVEPVRLQAWKSAVLEVLEKKPDERLGALARFLDELLSDIRSPTVGEAGRLEGMAAGLGVEPNRGRLRRRNGAQEKRAGEVGRAGRTGRAGLAGRRR